MDVTQLLLDWSNGDGTAIDKLLPVVYDELRRLAAGMLSHNRKDHTLQPTALVNEAYLHLVNQKEVKWENRAQFFGLASKVMRNILVDYARTYLSEKRGGNLRKISLDEITTGYSLDRSAELLALDEALEKLAELDERKSRVIELRYFGGLSIDEMTAVLEISPATIRREMRLAEAWLYDFLHGE